MVGLEIEWEQLFMKSAADRHGIHASAVARLWRVRAIVAPTEVDPSGFHK
ncbi:MAG: hypothetical protein ACXVCA_19980 [Bdellovibrio sp.]